MLSYLYINITNLAMVNHLNTRTDPVIAINHAAFLLYYVQQLISFFFFVVPSKNLQHTVAKPDLVLTEIKVRESLVTVTPVRSFTVSTESRQIC